MKANTPAERLYNGIVKENPTFVMMIGMCPTLAVTTSVVNGIGMGLTTTVILTLSNLMISAIRKFIPDGVRMPAYIGVVASFVTIVEFLLQAYIPGLNDALGIYIPLIVVNCIILGRAEAYAGKNPVLPSIFDGLGMRANTDAFKGQFQGRQAEVFSVTKGGASSENEIDALSGATITSNAVTGAVNAGIRVCAVLSGEEE